MGHLINMNNDQCIKKRRYRLMNFLEHTVLLTGLPWMDWEARDVVPN